MPFSSLHTSFLFTLFSYHILLRSYVPTSVQRSASFLVCYLCHLYSSIAGKGKCHMRAERLLEGIFAALRYTDQQVPSSGVMYFRQIGKKVNARRCPRWASKLIQFHPTSVGAPLADIDPIMVDGVTEELSNFRLWSAVVGVSELRHVVPQFALDTPHPKRNRHGPGPVHLTLTPLTAANWSS